MVLVLIIAVLQASPFYCCVNFGGLVNSGIDFNTSNMFVTSRTRECLLS